MLDFNHLIFEDSGLWLALIGLGLTVTSVQIIGLFLRFASLSVWTGVCRLEYCFVIGSFHHRRGSFPVVLSNCQLATLC